MACNRRIQTTLAACLLASPVLGQSLADEAADWMPQTTARPLAELVGPAEHDGDLPEIDPSTFQGTSANNGALAADDWAAFGISAQDLSGATPLDSDQIAFSDDDPATDSQAASTEATQIADEVIDPGAPPPDWEWLTAYDSRIAAPSGWITMEQDDDQVAIFKGDPSGPVGHLILFANNEDMPVDITSLEPGKEGPDGMMISAKGSLAIGDLVFDWAQVAGEDDGITMDTRLYVSRQLFGEDRQPLIIGFGAIGEVDAFDPNLRDQVLATLQPGTPAEPEAETPEAAVQAEPTMRRVFANLVHFPAPAGWSWLITHESGSFTGPTGKVEWYIGDDAIEKLSLIPAGASPVPSWQGGHPAKEYDIDGGRLVIWDDCPDPDEPLVMLMLGDQLQGSADEYTILSQLVINMPSHSAPCGDVASGQDMQAPDTASPSAQSTAAAPTQTPPPAPVPQTETSAYGDDTITQDPSGYWSYRNARYGMTISYPGTYFQPDPAPANGDGRRFQSVDGQASFVVFSQYDALNIGPEAMWAQDRASFDQIYTDEAEEGAYLLIGYREGQMVARRVIWDHDGLTRVFELTWPTARDAEFQPVARHMASSFGPPPKLAPSPVAVPQPPGVAPVPQPPATAPVPQPPATTPQTSPGVGLTDKLVGNLYTPARGTGERSAIMDASRVPVVPIIGQHVIFVVDVLNSDGYWAFLQATPVNPDGTPLNWSRTNLARDWAADAMSDIVMVLLINDGRGWRAIDWAVGPTDVAWMDWVRKYMLPLRLFQ